MFLSQIIEFFSKCIIFIWAPIVGNHRPCLVKLMNGWLILMCFCTVDLSPVPDRGAHICLHPPRNSAGDC